MEESSPVVILSVVDCGKEYRCEQKEVMIIDCRGERYPEKIRSKWLAADGTELDDQRAMILYRSQTLDNTKDKLLSRLWST